MTRPASQSGKSYDPKVLNVYDEYDIPLTLPERSDTSYEDRSNDNIDPTLPLSYYQQQEPVANHHYQHHHHHHPHNHHNGGGVACHGENYPLLLAGKPPSAPKRNLSGGHIAYCSIEEGDETKSDEDIMGGGDGGGGGVDEVSMSVSPNYNSYAPAFQSHAVLPPVTLGPATARQHYDMEHHQHHPPLHPSSFHPHYPHPEEQQHPPLHYREHPMDDYHMSYSYESPQGHISPCHSFSHSVTNNSSSERGRREGRRGRGRRRCQSDPSAIRAMQVAS
eukprot:CAMPEP_0172508776 /NCGR_PEP_ID=MMETSP1066-20121228/214791_1 /TAXON_ID=671091 /ORGANISM="Coscinodiscus wailesii, Strain CCMP2513" /LENGTH=276 /DNA_ID=CAMNT_0013286935 /DNA_START=88 /DNA_END=915 /DNA_ORIENTATION=-